MRYKLIISYDGTAYRGWQVQPDSITVQEQIHSAIREFSQQDIIIHGSGRTDAGVHAIAQVAHFDLDTRASMHSLHKALNALLPADIRIMQIEEVSDDFHARRSAISKEYRYFFWNDSWMPPHLRLYRTHRRYELNVDRMREAAQHLVGKHDFEAFSSKRLPEGENTVRTISALELSKDGSEICLRAVGNGFLYKMVRSIAGYLVRVGEGHIGPESAPDLLAGKVRTPDIPTARPEGLFLWSVDY